MSQHLRHYIGSPIQRVLQAFHRQQSRPSDGTNPSRLGVEGSAGLFGLIVTLAQGLYDIEPTQAKLADPGLAPTAQDYVSRAPFYDFSRLAYSLSPAAHAVIMVDV